jgi:small subunit ribosomal protein S9
MADNFIFAVGKRKESVARLRLYKEIPTGVGFENAKKGEVLVNSIKAEDYFKGLVVMQQILDPLRSTNTLENYFVSVKVVGGGKKGQADALVHALSRALSGIDPKHRAILKKKGLLTRDARVRERRKVGMGGKSRRKRQSPKR